MVLAGIMVLGAPSLPACVLPSWVTGIATFISSCPHPTFRTPPEGWCPEERPCGDPGTMLLPSQSWTPCLFGCFWDPSVF